MVFVRYLFLSAVASWVAVAHGFDPSQQDDSLALVRHFKVPEKPLEMPENGGLIGEEEGLTISLMGGTDVFRMQEYGYLEYYLLTAVPRRKLRIRNLGWPADTVYRQQRPMFFFMEEGDTREGSEPDGRNKIEPGIFVLSFGKMESLDGPERLGDFEKAYDRLISELKKLTHRVAVLEPSDFDPAGPAAVLAEERNSVLEQYREVIERLTVKHKIALVGFQASSKPPEQSFLPLEAFTEPSGIHLHPNDLRRQLHSLEDVLAGGVNLHKIPANHDEIIERILEKNRLWDQYYRPTNWAFLYGDRQHVPSSRDHKNSDRRWFVEELNRIPALIAEKEKELWDLELKPRPVPPLIADDKEEAAQ